jgi:threonine dehydrogenase-like Zn-dependent dehydrogenase
MKYDKKSSMKALVWVAPNKMEIRDEFIPELAEDEILIQVSYAGICGSELSGYLGHNALRVPPLIMGHEFSGKIVALGADAKTRNPALEMGQLVTVNPMVYCGVCEFCLAGETHLCTSRRLIGAHRPGAFAEFTAVPAWMVSVLPEKVSLREGSLTEPLACGVRIGKWAGDLAGKSALVIGAGTIGLFSTQVLLMNGAERVFISDTDANRRAAAVEFGGVVLNPFETDVPQFIKSETGNKGVTVSVDAVGKAVTRAQCVASTQTGGKVILSGLHEETSAVPVADVIRREITLQGSFCYSAQDFETATHILAESNVSKNLRIEEAPLDQGGAWFERLSAEQSGGVAKVLLMP